MAGGRGPAGLQGRAWLAQRTAHCTCRQSTGGVAWGQAASSSAPWRRWATCEGHNPGDMAAAAAGCCRGCGGALPSVCCSKHRARAPGQPELSSSPLHPQTLNPPMMCRAGPMEDCCPGLPQNVAPCRGHSAAPPPPRPRPSPPAGGRMVRLCRPSRTTSSCARPATTCGVSASCWRTLTAAWTATCCAPSTTSQTPLAPLARSARAGLGTGGAPVALGAEGAQALGHAQR